MNDIDKDYDTDESWIYLRRKTHKKMFEFNVMILGEIGLGKTSLINELFGIESVDETQLSQRESYYLYHTTNTYLNRKYPPIEIKSHNYEIERGRYKIKLCVTEVPLLGEAIDSHNCWEPISDYIDNQFEQYLKDESGINRKNINDNRIHCVLYLINPNYKRLKNLDIEILKSISYKCNVLPILAKIDMYNSVELDKIKTNIKNQLINENICIYPFPEYDPEESDEFNTINEQLKKTYPLSVVCGGISTIIDKKEELVRRYPWGTLIIDDPNLSDLKILKTMFRKTHVNDFKDMTELVHYENYRTWRLSGSQPNERSKKVTRELII